MPMMKPPHYQGIVYNLRRVESGATQVLEADVEALLAAGWQLETPTELPKKKAKKPRKTKRRAADTEES